MTIPTTSQSDLENIDIEVTYPLNEKCFIKKGIFLFIEIFNLYVIIFSGSIS